MNRLYATVLCAVVFRAGLVSAQDVRTTVTVPEIITTSAPETTTTPAPETITTPAPETTTSSTPVTTITPEPPAPEEGSWNITDGNVTCIRAVLKIGFTINLDDQKLNFSLSPKASDSGSSCNTSNTTQLLALTYQPYVLAFVFEKEKDNYFVHNVTLNYITERGMTEFRSEGKLFLVRMGNSYLCKTTDSINMGNATMDVYNIHMQAFGTDDQDGFGTVQECEADDAVNDVIVIAVACALAGLIIIVLITYLIGRRRSRQRGYTSV